VESPAAVGSTSPSRATVHVAAKEPAFLGLNSGQTTAGITGAEKEENTNETPREHQENTKRIRREQQSNTGVSPEQMACRWFVNGFKAALPAFATPARLARVPAAEQGARLRLLQARPFTLSLDRLPAELHDPIELFP
jgi:aryl-alcohol dehydrogenase-like predicted oxidoreductase